MATYYEEDDLGRFGEVGRERPDLYAKFMEWYGATLAEGELTRREKALIGLAVAHTLQCPYCVDSFTQQCLESGSNAAQMTEAVHVAASVRGGSALVHGVQMINSLDKVSM
ncbi:MAG: carboxymuconolactone decarboxylase family protein [Armatimonadetes bacterium]|nr:carboxymuconolactone decarboxylase family protein [Armatimonadota bacterium]